MKYKLTEWIVGEDDDYVIINKPPFIASLEDRHISFNILAAAKEIYSDPQLCHRLDKETSGILVIAKNPEAYRSLAMQFEAREVDKVYHAVVNGVHDIDGVLVDAPLYVGASGKVRVSFSKGKPSATLVKTAKAYKGATLIYCKPITGRMHQIRVHAAYLKASLVNDVAYGGKELFLSQLKKKFNLKRDTVEQPLIKRVALHSSSITFKNLKGEEVTYEADYPKDFRVLIKQLEKNS